MNPTIKQMEPMKIDSQYQNDKGDINTFHQDHYHMGQEIGKHLIMMFANHTTEDCKYLIFINTLTGERFKLTF